MRKITGLKIENGSTCFGLNMVGHAHLSQLVVSGGLTFFTLRSSVVSF